MRVPPREKTLLWIIREIPPEPSGKKRSSKREPTPKKGIAKKTSVG